MYTAQYIHEFQCINLSDSRHTCIHSSSRGEQAHGVQQGGHGERGQRGGPMSSPPPTLPLEEVPRPHAGDTTGGAGDVGGTKANLDASRSEVQDNDLHGLYGALVQRRPVSHLVSEGLHLHGSQCILFATFLLFHRQLCRSPLGLGAISTRTV